MLLGSVLQIIGRRVNPRFSRNYVDLISRHASKEDFPIKVKVSYTNPEDRSIGKIGIFNDNMITFSVEDIWSECETSLYSTIFEIDDEDVFPDHAIVDLTEKISNVVRMVKPGIVNSQEEQEELFKEISSFVNSCNIEIDRCSLKVKNLKTGHVDIAVMEC